MRVVIAVIIVFMIMIVIGVMVVIHRAFRRGVIVSVGVGRGFCVHSEMGRLESRESVVGRLQLDIG